MTNHMEIICTGNELLIGKTLNTSANWLAKRAIILGLMVKRITVAADNVDEIAIVIREALQRKPRLIIITGGLGPTFDDKTLEGIAKALNHKLKINEKALKMVKEKYEVHAKEGRMKEIELTQSRVKMATIPQSAEPLTNPVGTAPGVKIEIGETFLIALPGVPGEMEAIFKDTVVPLLQKEADKKLFFEYSIYTDSLMESTLAPLIDKVMHDNPCVYIKSHPKGKENNPQIEIHFSTIVKDGNTGKILLEKATFQLSNMIKKTGGVITKKINSVI